MGIDMLNEEIVNARVGDMKGHSQGSYTRRGNASMELDPPWGIKDVVVTEIPRRNRTLAAKDLGKTKTINKEEYARRWDAAKNARTMKYLMCEHSVLGKLKEILAA